MLDVKKKKKIAPTLPLLSARKAGPLSRGDSGRM